MEKCLESDEKPGQSDMSKPDNVNMYSVLG